jgi:hypothetical protein
MNKPINIKALDTFTREQNRAQRARRVELILQKKITDRLDNILETNTTLVYLLGFFSLLTGTISLGVLILMFSPQ